MWLVLDVNNMCYRAFHTLGRLSYQDVMTGVIYGFLRDVVYLQDRFRISNTAFCFDLGTSCRKQMFPMYRHRREEQRQLLSGFEKKGRKELYRQITLLREEYLPRIGFRNIFAEEGYEADDMIGRCTEKLGETIVVSTDTDLYQLLSPSCSIFRQGRLYTYSNFVEEWKIKPSQWIAVKALAGCKSDDISGVPGIGEKGAVKWIKGNASPRVKALVERHQDLVHLNLGVVQVPLDSTPQIKKKRDRVTLKKWRRVVREMGMKTLIHNPPLTATMEG